MNPEMDEDPRNFLDVVAATDPWLPPHSLISQPEAASFRPLPFNGSFHCSVVHRLTPMDQTRDVHTDCAHALLSMVLVYVFSTV